ncbi:MAG: DUF896 domain-containing protein [Clostridiales bacterium]|nr:DUF896 domain-containing protein [Clostridiales bacterium]
MKQEKIERINELAHKAKGTGLTAKEKLEQAELREEFLSEIRADIRASLESIELIDDESTQS